MRIARRRLVALAASVSFAGCETPTIPSRDQGAPIQTDTTTYLLVRDYVGWRTAIPVRFRNLASDTLYIENCNGATAISLEKQVGDRWLVFWSPAIPACLSPPIVIAPGATRADTVRIWGAEPGHNVLPDFRSTDLDGIYRLVWQAVLLHYRFPQGGGTPAPFQDRYSNSFRLLRS